MDKKNRFLIPLMITATASVIAFSSIGVAAITGHLSIGQSHLNPFAGFVSKSSPSTGFVPVAADTKHLGLTRRAGQAPSTGGKPLDFRHGARVPARKPACADCGVVDAIRTHEAGSDSFGPGTAAGFASMVGNQMERQVRSAINFVVTVRMEDGTVRTIHENQRPPFSIGERVKLVNGSVTPLG